MLLRKEENLGQDGFMANHIHCNPSYSSRKARIVEDIRRVFEHKKLLNYRITNIEDKAPVISEVYVDITVEYNNQQFHTKQKYRMKYEGENIIHGDEGGEWKIVNGYHELEYIAFQNNK